MARRWGKPPQNNTCMHAGAKLVRSHEGLGCEWSFKHRMFESDPKVYRACDSLQHAMSRLYQQIGLS